MTRRDSGYMHSLAHQDPFLGASHEHRSSLSSRSHAILQEVSMGMDSLSDPLTNNSQEASELFFSSLLRLCRPLGSER